MLFSKFPTKSNYIGKSNTLAFKPHVRHIPRLSEMLALWRTCERRSQQGRWHLLKRKWPSLLGCAAAEGWVSWVVLTFENTREGGENQRSATAMSPEASAPFPVPRPHVYTVSACSEEAGYLCNTPSVPRWPRQCWRAPCLPRALAPCAPGRGPIGTGCSQPGTGRPATPAGRWTRKDRQCEAPERPVGPREVDGAYPPACQHPPGAWPWCALHRTETKRERAAVKMGADRTHRRVHGHRHTMGAGAGRLKSRGNPGGATRREGTFQHHSQTSTCAL